MSFDKLTRSGTDKLTMSGTRESRHRQRPAEGMTLINVSLPARVVAQLELIARTQRLSRSAIVAQLLRQVLEIEEPD
jgi:hypothetical protein